MRVLLTEDDAMVGQSLDRALTASGIAVDWVRSAADCISAMQSSGDAYSVLLLDLGLPDGAGLNVLRKLRREKEDIPVVIVTARDDVATRVAGLDAGADDYVVKPFDFDELGARIRAVVRRHEGQSSSIVIAGAVELDISRHSVSYGGQTSILTHKEFALLQALAERPGTILSRSQLEDHLYDWGNEVDSNAVDVLIHYIRRKFGKDIILNVRGVGWMIPVPSR